MQYEKQFPGSAGKGALSGIPAKQKGMPGLPEAAKNAIFKQKRVLEEVFKIDRNLISIRGIDEILLGRLENQGIRTIYDLQQKTRTRADRDLLARNTDINAKSLYIWSKQADLMRVEAIDAVASELLVKAGIRKIEDLAGANAETLKLLTDTAFNNENIAYDKTISVEDLTEWKETAGQLTPRLELNEEDPVPELVFLKDPFLRNPPPKKGNETGAGKGEGEKFFFGLSEIMTEIGRGIARAQHELDKSSIETQRYIDAQEELRNYGLSASWYALPETSFQMKVDYAVVQEEKTSGEKRESLTEPAYRRPGLFGRKLFIAPVNAKYQNYFKRNTSVASEVNFRIVPVPPPEGLSRETEVPDVKGLSVEEAKAKVRAARLIPGSGTVTEGKPENGRKTQVVRQSPEPGTVMAANGVVEIFYTEEG